MTCDPSTLIRAASAFRFLPRSEISAAKIYLLCQWANASALDPDVQRFIDQTGITDQGIIDALSDLVYGLKNTGTPSFWSREVIIYPMVGGTYATTRVNLKSPGTYDFVETAGREPDYTAAGVQGNLARTSFLDTTYTVPAARQNNLRIFHYLDQQATNATMAFYGANDSVGVQQIRMQYDGPALPQITYAFNDNTLNNPWNLPGQSLGAYVFQRAVAGTKSFGYDGYPGAAFVNTLLASVGTPNRSLYLLAAHTVAPVSNSTNARLSCWTLGDPFATYAEFQQYSAIWETFQTALARNHRTQHATVDDWALRVVANGGIAPKQCTLYALGHFANGLDTAALTAQMVSVNCLAPDNLTAAITPLILGPSNDPWTNENFVAGDLTVDGLAGNAINKALDTGIDCSTAIPTDTSFGVTCYSMTAVDIQGCIIGSKTLGVGRQVIFGISWPVPGPPVGSVFDCWNDGTGRVSGANALWRGFLSGNRVSAVDSKIYKANSATAFQQVAAINTSNSTRTTRSLYVFCWNNEGGGKILYDSHRISFAAIHLGLSTADCEAFFNLVQAMRTTMGGGYV